MFEVSPFFVQEGLVASCLDAPSANRAANEDLSQAEAMVCFDGSESRWAFFGLLRHRLWMFGLIGTGSAALPQRPFRETENRNPRLGIEPGRYGEGCQKR